MRIRPQGPADRALPGVWRRRRHCIMTDRLRLKDPRELDQGVPHHTAANRGSAFSHSPLSLDAAGPEPPAHWA